MSDEPIKLLILTSTSDMGGAERVALDLAARFDKRRFDPWVV